MAEDIYLKFESPSLEGDSVVKGHEKELALLAWSWGASQSGTTHDGPGGGKGKSSFQDLSCTMKMDTASATLLQWCAKGTHGGKATLIQRKAGDKPLDFLTLIMEDIIVSSVSMSGSGEDVMLNFSLNFARYEYKFAAQTEKGAKGVEKSDKYDIAKAESK